MPEGPGADDPDASRRLPGGTVDTHGCTIGTSGFVPSDVTFKMDD